MLNQLTAIEFKENGLKIGRAHNKMKNVWADLHPIGELEVTCNLINYMLIATNTNVISLQEKGP